MAESESQMLKKYISLINEGFFNNEKSTEKSLSPDVMFDLMAKYKMRITSYGRGIGVYFIDKTGKEHYEEFNQESNLNNIVLKAMEEITYHNND